MASSHALGLRGSRGTPRGCVDTDGSIAETPCASCSLTQCCSARSHRILMVARGRQSPRRSKKRTCRHTHPHAFPDTHTHTRTQTAHADVRAVAQLVREHNKALDNSEQPTLNPRTSLGASVHTHATMPVSVLQAPWGGCVVWGRATRTYVHVHARAYTHLCHRE